ncbi:MAG: hypothetical protein L6R42_003511 [Xanthoria sp. 1 TBL-2021]|nr:MAG: hypothetical protein L6R42_003511 [Xanthoria sp. 1 TBL-2021]
MNPADYIIQDTPLDFIPYPLVLGEDIAGTVEHVGSTAASKFSPGDRIPGLALGSAIFKPEQGRFQHYVVLDDFVTCKIPDSMSFTEAAVFPLCRHGSRIEAKPIVVSVALIEDAPNDIEAKFIFASGGSVIYHEISPATFGGFLPDALASGAYKIAPKPDVVPTKGIEGIQEGLNVLIQRISAKQNRCRGDRRATFARHQTEVSSLNVPSQLSLHKYDIQKQSSIHTDCIHSNLLCFSSSKSTQTNKSFQARIRQGHRSWFGYPNPVPATIRSPSGHPFTKSPPSTGPKLWVHCKITTH